jgi:ribosomal protein L11 methyltransferase
VSDPTVELWRGCVIVPVDTVPAFMEALAGSDGAVTAFEIEGTANWRVEAIYEVAPARTDVQVRLATAAASMRIAPPALDLAPLPDLDWIAESLKDLKPVDAGRFHIHGSHDAPSRRAGAINLCIDAGRAFGTGQHETTRGCLLALDGLARARRFNRPLDLGCGTGVLGLAIARLWRCKTIASDIDPWAVAATATNAKINRLTPWLQAVRADGLQHPALAAHAPYDLIVANILANPLVELSGPIADSLAPGGYIVLSGLLRHQRQQVEAAYRRRGLCPQRRIVLGEWPTLVMRAP